MATSIFTAVKNKDKINLIPLFSRLHFCICIGTGKNDQINAEKTLNKEICLQHSYPSNNIPLIYHNNMNDLRKPISFYQSNFKQLIQDIIHSHSATVIFCPQLANIVAELR